MQHSAKGASKIVKRLTLPPTSSRPIDLVVTELAVIGFENGAAILRETAPGVSVQQVLAATEAALVVPGEVPQMPIEFSSEGATS
jgi:acetate CoA/acetoacetate CoA-transferase beta subunit